MSRSYIRYTLLNRCGDTWEQKFNAPRFDIKNLIIPTKVPRLLEDDIIEAVRARVQQNKTIFRKQTKRQYLFTRMLLCGHCGNALFGDRSNGKPAYRHMGHKFLKGQRIDIDCHHFRFVYADLLENAIVEHLFSVFGDVAMIEQSGQRCHTQYWTNSKGLKFNCKKTKRN